MNEPLLEVRDLHTTFVTPRGFVRAVNGVSFEIPHGTTLGLVGESGCGKSVTALSIMRLVEPPGRIERGSIYFQRKHSRELNESDGRVNLLALKEGAMRGIRGAQIAMIFQDPLSALNPLWSVGAQIAEAVRAHEHVTHRKAWDRAVEMMRAVQIPDAALRARDYPHQLSGGLRQRAMIAIALVCRPQLLIADEPTTALDVTVQAQILDLLKQLQKEMHLSVLFISHDLGVIAQVADEVAVMYCGKIVEQAPTREMFSNPLHPYTIGLMESMPTLRDEGKGRPERLQSIEGTVPSLIALPPGCAFEPRCAKRMPECHAVEPDWIEKSPRHFVSCHLYR